MDAYSKNLVVQKRLSTRGIVVDLETAAALRRIERTLQRWAEMECGDGNDYASWCISRDETTGLPYMETHPHVGPVRKVRIPDREAGALERLAELCRGHGMHYFHQTDPRGCALYLANEPLNDTTYSSVGVAVCA